MNLLYPDEKATAVFNIGVGKSVIKHDSHFLTRASEISFANQSTPTSRLADSRDQGGRDVAHISFATSQGVTDVPLRNGQDAFETLIGGGGICGDLRKRPGQGSEVPWRPRRFKIVKNELVPIPGDEGDGYDGKTNRDKFSQLGDSKAGETQGPASQTD
jgi:hypothetical protein